MERFRSSPSARRGYDARNAMADDTKRCPYCAEEIRSEAVKCRYCGSLVETGTALSRTWYRRRDGKMVAGVCAGLADQFSISVTIIRLAFLLSALLGGGVGFIIYLALWVVMPYRYDEEHHTPLVSR
jgi:phage shock protein PspC (stress-responsive transcriptional regulator)